MNMHDEIFNPDNEVKLLEELDFKCVCSTISFPRHNFDAIIFNKNGLEMD